FGQQGAEVDPGLCRGRVVQAQHHARAVGGLVQHTLDAAGVQPADEGVLGEGGRDVGPVQTVGQSGSLMPQGLGGCGGTHSRGLPVMADPGLCPSRCRTVGATSASVALSGSTGAGVSLLLGTTTSGTGLVVCP